MEYAKPLEQSPNNQQMTPLQYPMKQWAHGEQASCWQRIFPMLATHTVYSRSQHHRNNHSTRSKHHRKWPFFRMRSKGSRFTLGVWGLRVCSLDVAFTFATVRNRPRDCYMAVPMVSSAEAVLFVSNVALLHFAWQAWHFVTFKRVL